MDHREFYDWLQRSMHTSVVLESIGRATQQERKQRSMSGKKKLVWEKKKKKRSRSRSRSKSSSDRGGAMELDAQRQSSSVALLSQGSMRMQKGSHLPGLRHSLEMGTDFSGNGGVHGSFEGGSGLALSQSIAPPPPRRTIPIDSDSDTDSASSSSDESQQIEVPWQPSYPTTSFSRLSEITGGKEGGRRESKAIAEGRRALKKLEQLKEVTR